MRFRIGFLIILTALFAFSITLKLRVTPIIAAPQEREIDVLTQYLKVSDLIPLEAFDLNREGAFTAHIYRHKRCNGGWLISAMQRNSEAVSLFSRQAIYRDYKMGNVFYLLGGKPYETFPEFGLWVSQKIQAVKEVLGMNDKAIQSVFAIRSFGECDKGGAL